jgi:hypothetical protein
MIPGRGATPSWRNRARERAPAKRRQTARHPAEPGPDTFPSRRRQARFIVSLPVRLTSVAAAKAKTKEWRGRTTNIGGGGCAVELATRLSPGTHVVIEVRTGIGPIRMETEVVWTRRLPGRAGILQHGLALADCTEVLDLPVGVLLGQWLRGLAKR